MSSLVLQLEKLHCSGREAGDLVPVWYYGSPENVKWALEAGAFAGLEEKLAAYVESKGLSVEVNHD